MKEIFFFIRFFQCVASDEIEREGKRTDEQEMTEIFLDPKNTILKFTENDKIIGSVLLVEKGHQLYLGMLTVSPELQNSGIGKKLLAEAENHAKSLNLTSIIMTVISVREELVAWYKRHGSEVPLEFIYLEKKI